MSFPIEACLADKRGRPTGGRQNKSNALASVIVGNAAVNKRQFMVLIVAGTTLLAGCGRQEDVRPPQATIAADVGDQGPHDRHVSASAPPPGPTANDQDRLRPIVAIETKLGKITVQLDAEHAPGTVRNFLYYANAGHYDQTIFHYVRPGEMILGGAFTADLKQKPTLQPIRNEAHNGLKNTRGTLAMSRSFHSIDSATCQFFVNLADNPALDHQDRSPEQYGYCVFGCVIAGMNVAERIAQAPAHDQGEFISMPTEPAVIHSIRLLP